MTFELWSDEYFQDLINQKIKYEIEQLFFVRHERKPTKEEYHEWFNRFIDKAECILTNFDLGICEECKNEYVACCCMEADG